jgi:hypothetical protein
MRLLLNHPFKYERDSETKFLSRIEINCSKRTLRLGAAVWVSLGVALGGCTEVRPWERGILAKEHMALEPYPVQSMYREHIYGAREASTGGGSAKGGGCGCY